MSVHKIKCTRRSVSLIETRPMLGCETLHCTMGIRAANIYLLNIGDRSEVSVLCLIDSDLMILLRRCNKDALQLWLQTDTIKDAPADGKG